MEWLQLPFPDKNANQLRNNNTITSNNKPQSHTGKQSLINNIQE